MMESNNESSLLVAPYMYGTNEKGAIIIGRHETDLILVQFNDNTFASQLHIPYVFINKFELSWDNGVYNFNIKKLYVIPIF